MNTPGSRKWACMRMRSPSTAPPLKGLVGSTAMMPTRWPAAVRRAVMRSVSVDFPALAGLLLVSVGSGNVVAGRTRLAQYGEVLRTATPARAPADPAALFPPASEGDERQELALAKLAFYQLLLRVGRLLCLLGALLLLFGVLRLGVRAPRAPRAN